MRVAAGADDLHDRLRGRRPGAGSRLLGQVTSNQGGATVAHTFGVVSLFAAECVEKFSLGVYNVTDREDGRRHNGTVRSPIPGSSRG